MVRENAHPRTRVGTVLRGYSPHMAVLPMARPPFLVRRVRRVRRAFSFWVFFMVSSLWRLILGTVAEGVALIEQPAEDLLRLGYCLPIVVRARHLEARLGGCYQCLKSLNLFHRFPSLGGRMLRHLY